MFDHPRVCGEPPCRLVTCRVLGIIPACAGEFVRIKDRRFGLSPHLQVFPSLDAVGTHEKEQDWIWLLRCLARPVKGALLPPAG